MVWVNSNAMTTLKIVIRGTACYWLLIVTTKSYRAEIIGSEIDEQVIRFVL